MCVGYREVREKRRRWQASRDSNDGKSLVIPVTPVVLGPGSQLFAVDCHHWMCMLADEGVGDVPVTVLADHSGLEPGLFWLTLERLGWCHPCDSEGRRQDYSQIPSSMKELQDDPFRSLASALKRAGVIVKDERAFSEFTWADELRRFMSKCEVEQDFATALTVARAHLQRVEHLKVQLHTKRFTSQMEAPGR
jgi:hypothetical protein